MNVSLGHMARILEAINTLACYASEENTDAQADALLLIGRLARQEVEPDNIPSMRFSENGSAR